ncbi:TonB-dependent siderophore receptor [Halalkalibaculum sp. DA384]|uniref:TonB-dependent siderophore receptor n=1 Tax=Halalkalibaculum sp. DA384 TaxID=3373606 RepID=UPI0037551FF9
MKRAASLLLLFAVTCISALAQQNQQFSISGTVTTVNGDPVVNANVVLEGTSHGASTTVEGRYEIAGVPEGDYTLVISTVGYKRFTHNLAVDRNLELDATLEQRVEAMGEVTVSGRSMANYNTAVISQSLRLNQELVSAPQNIQVITKDLIDDQQSIDMLESVSKNVSGAQMIEHWGNFARINMRGFRIPAFRNGMNLQSSWGPLAEDMVMVERIEFVKGPSAFMLSSGEPGGLYNVVTKKPVSQSIGEVGLTTGSYNTLRATVDVGGKLSEDGRLFYRFNGAGTTENSHREYGFNDRYTLAPSLSYGIGDNTTVTAQYSLQYSEMYIGSAYVFAPTDFGTLPRDFSIFDPRIEPTEMKEQFAHLNLTHQFNDNWSITGQLGYMNYDQVGNSMWLDSIQKNGDMIRRLSIWDARDEAKLGQLFLRGEEQTGGVSHNILAGLDFGYKNYFADWNQSGALDSQSQPFNIYNPSNANATIPEFDRETSLRKRAGGNIVRSEYFSYYLQDQLGFFDDRIRVTLAGRLTDYESSSYGSGTEDQVFSPRAAISFSVTENTSIYGMYDQSFIPQTGQNARGEAFDPERGNNLEGGIKREWANGRWYSTITYYHMTKENMLVGDPENQNYSIQLGEAVSKGVELDLRGQVAPGLRAVLNYANTDVKITEDTNPENVGTRVAGHARHLTNGWLTYTLREGSLEGLGLSLGYQYQVDRSSWNWNAENESYLPDYFRMDGALSWEQRNYSISLNLNNLLDEYLYSGANYGSYVYWQSEPGRNFRLSFEYAF